MNVSDLELQLDIPSLLEHYDIDTYTLRQVSQHEYRCACFIHGSDNDTSMQIKLSNGRWYVKCYSHNCFSGTLMDALMLSGRTFREVVGTYEVYQGVTKRPPQQQYKRHDEIVYLDDNYMDRYERAIHKDLIDDGYDRNQLLNVWSVRYCNDPNDTMYRRYVWPIRDRHGRIVSSQGRIPRQYESDEPKYLFNGNASVKWLIYGAYEQQERIRRSTYLIVTEGAKGVWRGYQLGVATVGLLGIRYTQEQVKRLAAMGKRMILVADNDTPGIDGMHELASELQRYVKVDVRVCPIPGSDISDFHTRDKWRSILGV